MLIEAGRGVTRLIATTTVEILIPEAGTGMQLIRELETTRDETLRYFSLDQRDLMRTYAPGKWSVRFVHHHLSDSETVLFDRIRRLRGG